MKKPVENLWEHMQTYGIRVGLAHWGEPSHKHQPSDTKYTRVKSIHSVRRNVHLHSQVYTNFTYPLVIDLTLQLKMAQSK